MAPPFKGDFFLVFFGFTFSIRMVESANLRVHLVESSVLLTKTAQDESNKSNPFFRRMVGSVGRSAIFQHDKQR